MSTTPKHLVGVKRLHVPPDKVPQPVYIEMFTQFAIGRFKDRLEIQENGCWHWMGCKSKKDGYGLSYMSFTAGGHKQVKSHRVSHAIFIGPVPEGVLVMHSCDNRICANPAHLSLGTDLMNSRDASVKGLMHPGTKTYGAVLTDSIVSEIRTRFQSGEHHTDIAKSIGHNRRTVWDAAMYRTWRHVT